MKESKKRKTNIGRRIICVMFFTSLALPNLTLFAQAPKGNQMAGKKKPAVKRCSGAWTGVATFTRTQRHANRKETPRVSMRGMDVRDYDMRGDYEAQIVVSEDSSGDGSSVARANVNSTFSFKDVTEAVEKNSCDKGKTWKDMKGSFETKTEKTGTEGGVQANVAVGIGADGHYGVSVGVSAIQGKASGTRKATYSGQCVPKENKAETMPDSVEQIDGKSMTSDGSHRVDPKSPDQLSGTSSIELPGGVVETITWNLRRCGGDLMITDLKLYQPLYPSDTTWIEIGKNGSTIDGNMVRIVATVVNLSPRAKRSAINFREIKEGSDSLPEGKMIQLNFDGGEEREVPVTWDTSGYAWKPGSVWASPEIHREIEVKLENEVKTAAITVKPKPVVVVPGLWSKPDLVFRFLGAFKSIPSTEWTAELARVAISKTAAENVPVIEDTVKRLQRSENAWHVDMVAHSTGGLMARSFINSAMERSRDGKPAVTQLVMVGTPNMGTPCSSGLETIFTRVFSKNVPAFNEVAIKNMKSFNERVKARKGTKFSVLVGNAFDPNCQMDGPGDGITPNRSAIWTVKQWKFSTVPARHEDQLGQQANFTQIVNWLAIPPNGDHRPQTEFFMGSASEAESFGKTRRYGAMARSDDPENIVNAAFGDEDAEPDFATGVKVASSQSKDVSIPVTKGSRLSVTFVAPPRVSATLVDASGSVVGKITAGTPEADAAFRTFTVRRPFENGTWTLKLENAETEEAEIAVVAFVDFASAIFREP